METEKAKAVREAKCEETKRLQTQRLAESRLHRVSPHAVVSTFATTWCLLRRRTAKTSRGKTALGRSRCAGNRDKDEEEKDREANGDQPPPAAQEMQATNRTLLGGPPEGEGIAVREGPRTTQGLRCGVVKVGPWPGEGGTGAAGKKSGEAPGVACRSRRGKEGRSSRRREKLRARGLRSHPRQVPAKENEDPDQDAAAKNCAKDAWQQRGSSELWAKTRATKSTSRTGHMPQARRSSVASTAPSPPAAREHAD